MGNVIITIRIMPENVDTDLESIKKSAEGVISDFGGTGMKFKTEPIAFGLQAVDVVFIIDETKGGTDALEAKLKELESIAGAETTDVRRAIG